MHVFQVPERRKGEGDGGEKGFPRTPHLFQGKRKAAVYFTKENPVFGFGLPPEQFYFLTLLPFYLFRAFEVFVPGRRRRVKVLRNKLFGNPLLTSNVIVRGHFSLNCFGPSPGFILFPDPYPL